jgi:MFS transporter, DHA1 family, tetracycline resistance protein
VRAEVAKRRAGPGSPLCFLFVAVFVDMIGYGIVVPLLPFYAREHASGAVLVGLLGSLYAAAQFVGGPFLGGLSDRAGRRPVLLCPLGASLAYLLLGLAGSLPLLVAAVALAGLAGATLATAQAYIADVTPPEDRARGLGLVGAAFGLGLVTGPALGGLLSLYSLEAPVFASAALALSNAVFGFFVLPESLPTGRRTRTPLLLLNPVSQLAGVLRMASIRGLLQVVFLLNLSFVGFRMYKMPPLRGSSGTVGRWLTVELASLLSNHFWSPELRLVGRQRNHFSSRGCSSQAFCKDFLMLVFRLLTDSRPSG